VEPSPICARQSPSQPHTASSPATNTRPCHKPSNIKSTQKASLGHDHSFPSTTPRRRSIPHRSDTASNTSSTPLIAFSQFANRINQPQTYTNLTEAIDNVNINNSLAIISHAAVAKHAHPIRRNHCHPTAQTNNSNRRQSIGRGAVTNLCETITKSATHSILPRNKHQTPQTSTQNASLLHIRSFPSTTPRRRSIPHNFGSASNTSSTPLIAFSQFANRINQPQTYTNQTEAIYNVNINNSLAIISHAAVAKQCSPHPTQPLPPHCSDQQQQQASVDWSWSRHQSVRDNHQVSHTQHPPPQQTPDPSNINSKGITWPRSLIPQHDTAPPLDTAQECPYTTSQSSAISTKQLIFKNHIR
jgi:hypothetical protein